MGLGIHGGDAARVTQEVETDQGTHEGQGAPGGLDGEGPSGVGTMHTQSGGDAPATANSASQE